MFNLRIHKALPRAMLLGLIGAAVAGSIVVYTNIQATDLGPGNQNVSLAVNTFVDDSEVTVDNSSITIVSASAVAAGGSAPGVEATVLTYAAVNSILTVDDYSYTFDMHETSGSDWEADNLNDFRIRTFAYDADGTTSTLLSTLFVDQGATDPAIEGVTVTIDLTFTTAIYDHFDIIVDRQ